MRQCLPPNRLLLTRRVPVGSSGCAPLGRVRHGRRQAPKGPAGRFEPYLPYFWGVWGFSKNKSAAKELIVALLQRDTVQERCDAVLGYDVPPFQSMLDFKVWEEVGPPTGTVYN